jgi:hypothetical protein
MFGGSIEEDGADSFSQLGGGVALRVEHSPVVAGGMLAPLSLEVEGHAGTTDDASWSRARGGASIGLAAGGRALEVSIDAGSTGSSTPWQEQFEIGGARSSLQPEAARSNLVEAPALPAGILRGSSFASARVDLRAGGWLPALFAQRIDVDVDSGDDGVSIAGLEWVLAVASMPVARVPALELRAGAARVVDDGLLEDETSVWLTMRWKP